MCCILHLRAELINFSKEPDLTPNDAHSPLFIDMIYRYGTYAVDDQF